MRLGRVAALAAFAFCSLVAAADARFAASNGEFSGRAGDTCSLCHSPPSGVPAARSLLDGLPERWDAGEAYTITISIEGGPPAAPRPQPRGGFELEASSGSFQAGPGMEGLMRFPQDNVITYTPEGTQHRSWTVVWTAPGTKAEPAPVTFWLATVAANGNHLVSGDDGESGDATSALVRTVRASEETVSAWQALPLAPPALVATRFDGDGWTLEGRHTDANATRLGYKLDDGPWKSVATARSWTLVTNHDPDRLALRSEGSGRVSPAIGEESDEASPAPSLLALAWALPALAAIAARRGGIRP